MVETLAPRQAKQVARSAVHSVAGKVRDSMKKKVCSQAQGDGTWTKTIAKALKTKRRRGSPSEAVSDVRIQHGKGVKNDAFFWHWVEFEYGGVARNATPFIRPTVDAFESQIPTLFRIEFGKKLEKKLAKIAQRQGVNKR